MAVATALHVSCGKKAWMHILLDDKG